MSNELEQEVCKHCNQVIRVPGKPGRPASYEPDGGVVNKFGEWLASKKISVTEASELLGISRYNVYGFRSGRTTPSVKIAVGISEASDGAVPVDSWSS